LTALRGDRVASNRRCRRTSDDCAWFAPELARFGGDALGSPSLTDALVFEDIDNRVERLFPMR
jgi:hypothetical protein